MYTFSALVTFLPIFFTGLLAKTFFNRNTFKLRSKYVPLAHLVTFFPHCLILWLASCYSYIEYCIFSFSTLSNISSLLSTFLICFLEIALIETELCSKSESTNTFTALEGIFFLGFFFSGLLAEVSLINICDWIYKS